jgi:hypothetical protein
MSVIILSLSIGGVFAGVAGGIATKVSRDTDEMIHGGIKALAGGAARTKASAKMRVYALAGALSGGIIGGGIGLGIESFNNAENTMITAPAAESSQKMIEACFANAPTGAQVSLGLDKNGKTKCNITIPSYN